MSNFVFSFHFFDEIPIRKQNTSAASHLVLYCLPTCMSNEKGRQAYMS